MTNYRVIEGSPQPDTQAFLAMLPAVKGLFTSGDSLIVTRAPGRLDVMGGIADYSGSLVLQLPIAGATHVALQKLKYTELRIVSLGSASETRSFEINLSSLQSGNAATVDYDLARQCFSDRPNRWAAYVAGVFPVLTREKGVRFNEGAAILINSSVPEGKGVSSSAALEVAVMQSVNVAFNLNLECRELAGLCQKVENIIAGAPCGIMDQMTSACGEENRLLELLCQPDLLKGTLSLPEELELWGIDSGVRHSVSGSDYGTVRTAAFMGYRIIADLAGLPVANLEDGSVLIDDLKWNGYLANITPAEFESKYAQALPQSLSGADFLDRYHGITDSVTAVRRDTEYPVLQATKHPIYEHARVTSFASIIKYWEQISQAPYLGRLMFESHQSYSDCGLGSEATDLVVDLVREMINDGLYGARITGGGSGGTVAVLGRRGSSAVIERLRQKFQERTGYLPLVISGSSSGASSFGHLKLQRSTTTNSSSV
jgi:galactokinase